MFKAKHRLILGTALLAACGMGLASSYNESVPSPVKIRPVAQKIFVNPLVGFGEGADDSDVGLAFGGAVGYRFNSLIMAEVDAMRSPRGDDSSILIAAGPRFTANFSDGFKVYTKIGLGVVHNTGDHSFTRFATMLGLGGSYAFAPSWGVSAEASGSLGSDANTYSLVAGPYFTF